MAALEGGVAALATASGAAAVTYTIQALARQGDHIVAQKTIYGGTYNLLAHTLPQYGITATFVDAHDAAAVEAAIQPNTRAVYLETLGNPNCDIPNIEAIAAVAHRHGLPLVIDNTFGTPYWVKVIPLGADIVVHSATKFLGGHGTTLGGIIVDAGMFDWAASGSYPQLAAPNPSYHGISFVQAAGKAAFVTYVRAILLRDTGATISPFNAFLLLQGIETLSLRLDRHAENTKRIVSWLAAHPQVARVNHPSLPDHPDHALYQKYFPNGGGSIFTFEIAGGEAEAHRFIDHLKIFSLLAKENVNVDIILQSIGRHNTKDISFTVNRSNKQLALELMEDINERCGGKGIICDDNISKVSIVGAGMQSNPGVASKMFEALYEAGINIQMINTSEIRVSVLLDEEDVNRAVRAIHDKFFGEI